MENFIFCADSADRLVLKCKKYVKVLLLNQLI